MAEKDDILVDRSDLQEARDIVEIALHKSTAEDLIDQYRKLGRAQYSSLTKSLEMVRDKLEVYLKEDDDVPAE
jgi:hypothetical protein